MKSGPVSRPRGRTSFLLGLLVVVLLPAGAFAAAGGMAGAGRPARTAAPQQLADGEGELIAAVGDIACAPTNPVYRGGEGSTAGCKENNVADLLAGQRLAAFLPLGDLQYENGTHDEFANVYDQFFGGYKAITRPVPGNHEYKTANGAGYYDYFGVVAQEKNSYQVPGTYSYNVGKWHLIAINSVLCSPGTPCDDNSALLRWLKADLAANPASCTLAYWHHPLWSAGAHGAYAPMTPVWNTLLDAGADVILTSHDHNYQRFAPLGRATATSSTTMAPPVVVPEAEGMRTFIVGTGGANNYSVATDAQRPDLAGSVETSYAGSAIALFGMLFLRLGDGRYEWSFSQAAPAPISYSDAGVGTCH
ncbi:hypothetical protein Asp14428_10560 [Actinoplanes sp. NBRC 14428]|uniref:Calcineurin-like phosphoesterase family protein n=1 Tax=Pseudosporangium ferrugineum TaxID=439699 RepID=A0A2T0SFI9_9ACTN|nr:metallophosphoesterase [Pseudosporangium ferrugineum]PRY32174.1 calcineurin-like phosphoesterase family protein [Pseudosporangium ferrugineum]BCJ49581.1 hypothetical protein Asp14428_10560 [Actinoplanes sp. NBRC 14428]